MSALDELVLLVNSIPGNNELTFKTYPVNSPLDYNFNTKLKTLIRVDHRINNDTYLLFCIGTNSYKRTDHFDSEAFLNHALEELKHLLKKGKYKGEKLKTMLKKEKFIGWEDTHNLFEKSFK